MSSPRVLLCGYQWVGDLLAFCERALSELGVSSRIVATNGPRWHEDARRRDALARVPGGGRFAARRWWERNASHREMDFARRLEAAAKEFRPDIVLAILCWGHPVTAKALDGIAARKVGWLMDDPFGDDGALAKCLSAYDHLFCVDRAWSVPARLVSRCELETLPCGADLASHRPVENAARKGLVFVGSSYRGKPAGVTRERLLSRIADLPLSIYGDAGWGQVPCLARNFAGRGASSEEANRLYNEASGVINIHHPQWKAGTSLRTFALCASGAAQLVDWRPDLERYFDLDRELLSFRDADELRAGCERLLHDAPFRNQMARAGLERVRREHTYAHRMKVILERCG